MCLGSTELHDLFDQIQAGTMTEPYISEITSQTDYTLENFNSFERNCLMHSTIKVRYLED